IPRPIGSVDLRTKEAKEIEENDLPHILRAYKEYKASKTYEHLQESKDMLKILQTEPSCFLMGEHKLADRIDATVSGSTIVLHDHRDILYAAIDCAFSKV
ncbi:MAG: hypothetical protein AAB325_18155, partial [Pseudomonadota bacterium]